MIVSDICFHQLALCFVIDFPIVDAPVFFLALSTQDFPCTRLRAENTTLSRVLTPSPSLSSDSMSTFPRNSHHKSKSPEPLRWLVSHSFFAMRTFVLSGFNLWNLPRCPQLRAFCLYLNGEGGGGEGETDMPNFRTGPVSRN